MNNVHYSCVPLFELVSSIPKEQLRCKIDRAALMNAVYQHFPEYAAQHNLAEQAGLNDGLGQFLHTQGIDVELKGVPERLISLTAQAGTQVYRLLAEKSRLFLRAFQE